MAAEIFIPGVGIVKVNDVRSIFGEEDENT